MSEPDTKRTNADLAFMEEIVAVTVLPSTAPNAGVIVEIWTDGRPARFVRGQRQLVKRKYVEALARAKPCLPPRTGLLYPFQVDEDKNPKGSAWLQSVLAEA